MPEILTMIQIHRLTPTPAVICIVIENLVARRRKNSFKRYARVFFFTVFTIVDILASV